MPKPTKPNSDRRRASRVPAVQTSESSLVRWITRFVAIPAIIAIAAFSRFRTNPPQQVVDQPVPPTQDSPKPLIAHSLDLDAALNQMRASIDLAAETPNIDDAKHL